MIELIVRFLIVGALAFGGGQAALPLLERLTVGETGWLTPRDFATGVGLAYATPGPVLVLASFVGYRVAGVAGAAGATLAVFAVPIALAALAAQITSRLATSTSFRTFGKFAGAAAVGLLGVTLVTLARPIGRVNPLLLALSATVFIAAQRRVPPVGLLAVAALLGAVVGWIS